MFPHSTGKSFTFYAMSVSLIFINRMSGLFLTYLKLTLLLDRDQSKDLFCTRIEWLICEGDINLRCIKQKQLSGDVLQDSCVAVNIVKLVRTPFLTKQLW